MKMHISGEIKFVESRSSRKTGRTSSEGWGCHPTVKSSDPELFLSEGNAGTVEKSRKGGPLTGPNWDIWGLDTVTDAALCL